MRIDNLYCSMSAITKAVKVAACNIGLRGGKILTASDDTRWTSIFGVFAYPPHYAGHHTAQRKGAEHDGASGNATGARDPMGHTASDTGAGISGRTARATPEK